MEGWEDGRTWDPGTKLTATKIHRTLVDHDEPTTAKPRTVVYTTIQTGVLPSLTCPLWSRISIFYFPLPPPFCFIVARRQSPASQPDRRAHASLTSP